MVAALALITAQIVDETDISWARVYCRLERSETHARPQKGPWRMTDQTKAVIAIACIALGITILFLTA